MTIFSATLLLFLIMDAFGNVPLFLSAVEPVAPERRRKVIIRELLIALVFLVIFLFSGSQILKLIGISEATLTVAGGIILFLIALHMVFPNRNRFSDEDIDGEPLIVPLAIPFIAGPSALASVIFIMNSDPTRWVEWLIAVIIAWGMTGLVLIFSLKLSQILGRRGLIAIERLMGMILTAIATKMILTGIKSFFGF